MFTKRSSVAGNERFQVRRRIRRRRIVVGLTAVIGISLGVIIYELWQAPMRISRIEVFGGDASHQALAARELTGTYVGVIPRNSTFFYPASAIRRAIMDEHPDVAAVSLFRKGLSGLSIKVTERVGIARWCGLAPTLDADEYCYVFDANGFVFAAADQSPAPIHAFRLYVPLAQDAQEPLRATLLHAQRVPIIFDFARQLSGFGSPAEYIVVEGDEVTTMLKSGSSVVYVLGSERSAFTALSAAKENLNLRDGSVEYVDLRFGNKVYVKKRN